MANPVDYSHIYGNVVIYRDRVNEESQQELHKILYVMGLFERR